MEWMTVVRYPKGPEYFILAITFVPGGCLCGGNAAGV
jgi:hypothetical protein